MKRVIVITGLLATFLLSSSTVTAQFQSRSDVRKEIEKLRAELIELEKNYLAPADEDRALYADLLRQPDTGLIRLLPRDQFDTEVNKQNKKSITMRGGGAYYSFHRKTQEYGYGSDIELARGHLLTGFAGADYGMLTDLGDIPLETVGPDMRAVNLFAGYKVPREEQLARSEARRLSQGAELEGLPVSRRLPLKLNSTYLLRSINYPSSDVLVAFKVVRIDSDGSATLLWKLLKKYNAPQFTPA